jgi:DNA-binding transcriptional ArsR family regulator
MTARKSSKSSPEIIASLAEAMGDPIRQKVAFAIRVAPGLTVRQIADRIGESPRRIRYQLTVLRRADLVEISDQESRRGAIEHRYTLTRPLYLTDEENDSLPTHLKMRVATEVVRGVVADVEAATKEGTFGVRSGDHLSHLFGKVDEVGWTELVEASLSYLEHAQQLLEKAEKRIEASGDVEAIPVTAALFLFEGPDRPSASEPD